jgi:hypothetical protein
MLLQDLTCETNNDLCLTMKWFERIAQGFNPGLVGRSECPESGTRIWDWLVESTYESQKYACRTPLSGRISRRAYPGLKPWAVLSDHFMVKKAFLNATPLVQVDPKLICWEPLLITVLLITDYPHLWLKR